MKRASFLHEYAIGNIRAAAYLYGAEIVWLLKIPTLESEGAIDYQRAVEKGNVLGASEICVHYGVPRGKVRMYVTHPEGRTEKGRFKLTDCRIVLQGPTRYSRGTFPDLENERAWRNLFLSTKSQVLYAATLPKPVKKRSSVRYKHPKSARIRRT